MEAGSVQVFFNRLHSRLDDGNYKIIKVKGNRIKYKKDIKKLLRDNKLS